MNEWIHQLADLTASGEPVVIVTIAAVRGSAPREVGARMLVTETETLGTIGGGQLEYQCTRLAVERLRRNSAVDIERFPLGSATGQCCGGVVDVLFETVADGLPSWLRTLGGLHGQRTATMRITSLDTGERLLVTEDQVFGDSLAEHIDAARLRLADGTPPALADGVYFEPIIGSHFDIAVFGAGHVGSALLQVLSTLDCNVHWIDSRRNIFRHVPNNALAIESRDPALEVSALPRECSVLVMTHSHALDFDICVRALRRNDLAYVGLIGSTTKRRRFIKRFREHGLSDTEINRLTSPIGVSGVTGKKPAEIAVSVATDLLARRDLRARGGAVDNVMPLRR